MNKKSKKIKKDALNQTLKSDNKMERDNVEEHSSFQPKGILPDRDLKKNLGCG